MLSSLGWSHIELSGKKSLDHEALPSLSSRSRLVVHDVVDDVGGLGLPPRLCILPGAPQFLRA